MKMETLKEASTLNYFHHDYQGSFAAISSPEAQNRWAFEAIHRLNFTSV